MTRHFYWREATTFFHVELNPVETSWLIAEGIAEVKPTPVAGIVDVVVGNVCGMVSVGDLQISIAPKLPVNSIIWMMLYARTGMRWRPENSTLGSSDLIEGLAEVYSSMLDDASRTGLLRGYQTVKNTDFTLRGRIRMADQLSRHHGQLIPLEIEHDDYNHNIPENRILRSAIDVMLEVLTQNQHQSTAVRKLQHLRGLFIDVEPLTPDTLRPSWQPDRLNERFIPAITLAESILEHTGIQVHAGELGARGILLKMWEVFEEFVASALRREAPGLTTHTQYKMHLDTESDYPIYPDLVLTDGGAVVAVMDTKYKVGAPKSQDLYQALSYAVTLGLNEATLIYPQARPTQLINVNRSEISIRITGIDLSREPDVILQSVRELAPPTTP